MKQKKSVYIGILALVLLLGIIIPPLNGIAHPNYSLGLLAAPFSIYLISWPFSALLTGLLIWVISQSAMKRKLLISSVAIFFETWVSRFLIAIYAIWYNNQNWYGKELEEGGGHFEENLTTAALHDMYIGFWAYILVAAIFIILNAAQYWILHRLSHPKSKKPPQSETQQ